MTSIEKGYVNDVVMVNWNNQIVQAITYFGKPELLEKRLLLTKEYLSFLITGAKEHYFSPDYISILETQECNDLNRV